MLNLKTSVLAGLVALPIAAYAQPAAHDWEVVLGGSGRATSDFHDDDAGNSAGSFGAALSLGYYLTDNAEIAVRQNLNYVSNGSWQGYTRAAFDYNFIMDKLVPFIGINIGYNYANKGRDDNWAFAPEAGIKYYLLDKAFLFGMAEYAMPFEHRVVKDGSWIFTVGLGVNL